MYYQITFTDKADVRRTSVFYKKEQDAVREAECLIRRGMTNVTVNEHDSLPSDYFLIEEIT